MQVQVGGWMGRWRDRLGGWGWIDFFVNGSRWVGVYFKWVNVSVHFLWVGGGGGG